MTGNDDISGYCILRKKLILVICKIELIATIFHRPRDGLVQRCITLNTGNQNLILQRKVSLIHNVQFRQAVCTARLPKDFCAVHIRSLFELKGRALGGTPSLDAAVSVPLDSHFKSHIQRTCLNLVHRRAGGVCKPGEGCGD